MEDLTEKTVTEAVPGRWRIRAVQASQVAECSSLGCRNWAERNEADSRFRSEHDIKADHIPSDPVSFLGGWVE